MIGLLGIGVVVIVRPFIVQIFVAVLLIVVLRAAGLIL